MSFEQSDLDLLTIEQLAREFFGTTPNALYLKRCRDPRSLPPAIRLPSTKQIFFSRRTVIAWFLAHEERRDLCGAAARQSGTNALRRGAPTKTERREARKLGIGVRELREMKAGGGQ